MALVLLCLLCFAGAVQDTIFSQFWPLAATNRQQGFATILYACFPNIADPSEWWLCLANLDNRNTSQPIFNVRAVVRATLQGADRLKSISATLNSTGEVLFVTHSNQGKSIYLHYCNDVDCTQTTKVQLGRNDRSTYFPRLKLNDKENPLIGTINVDHNNQASLSLITCADHFCEDWETRDLFDFPLPEWSPSQLVSFDFTLTENGGPLFIIAYNSTITSFECNDFLCHHPEIVDVVSSDFISDAHYESGILVSALNLDAIEVITIDSEIAPTSLPIRPFEAISIVSQVQTHGFKIATSRWESSRQYGVVQYIDCSSSVCLNYQATDLDQFSVNSGWAPSIALAETKPGDSIIFYFRFGELGLYSQICQPQIPCFSHKLHNGLNITMNSDQNIPLHFWNAYWALVLFVLTVVGLIALFGCVRRTVNHVRRIEYANVQTDTEGTSQVVVS